jgi:hypothetical protein
MNALPDNVPDQNLIILGRSSSRANSRLAANIIREPSLLLDTLQVVEELLNQNHPIFKISLNKNDRQQKWVTAPKKLISYLMEIVKVAILV